MASSLRIWLPVCLGLAACGDVTVNTDTLSQALSTKPSVARIELAAPELPSFILRTTVPLPPNTYHGPGEHERFFVRDSAGTTTEAQVESVSRYANSSQGSDVVELLARVARPANASAGQTISYDVLYATGSGANQLPIQDGLSLHLPDVVQQLLASPTNIVVRARDVYDNYYACALDLSSPLTAPGAPPFSAKVLREGPIAVQTRAHGVMQLALLSPTGGPPLPHLFGVHAYLTAWSDERVVSLDLRVHNGLSGADASSPLDNPLGREYFKDIELLVPKGWLAYPSFEDPAWGPGYDTAFSWSAFPIVAPRADGTMHLMPSQAQLHRRYVLAPPPNPALQDWPHAKLILEQQGLGFCQPGQNAAGEELWSWWNPQTARYFPQRQALPTLEHLSKDALLLNHKASFESLLTKLLAGTGDGIYPLYTNALGWAHPWGTAYGGMTGGAEIVMWEGIDVAWAASNMGYRNYELVHRMQTDRQPNVLYDLDGNPTRLEEWLHPGPHGPYTEMAFYMKLLMPPDPFGFDQSPEFQEDYVEQHALAPDYGPALELYESYDMQHLVRYLRSAKVLAWLGNDAIAKDDLAMQAELVRLSYNSNWNSAFDTAIVSGMKADQLYVAGHPQRGFDFGRGEGWGIDAMSTAFALGSPEWRAQVRPWFDDVVALVANGQAPCSGFIQAYAYEKVLDGKYQGRQSIEQAIIENALEEMMESVYRGEDPARVGLLKGVLGLSTMSMVSWPAWSEELVGPVAQLAVAPLQDELPPFCGWLPYDGQSNWIDNYQNWSSFAYGYQLTKLPVFLVRCQQMLGGPLLQKLQQAGLENLGNRAALLRLAQDLAK